MPYKKVRKSVTPKELGVNGYTAGDFLLNLQKMLPVSPLDAVLPNGMKLSIGNEKMEIKLPKNKEIWSDVIEEILTEGTKLLLEENRRRDIDNRNRIKITMSLGDNTVYFAQGHLDRLPDGTVMPMYPILKRTDDTFVRVIDPIFTSDMHDLGLFIQRQHNRILGHSEEDRTQEIAEKLGFTTVEKDDSIIDVQINGVTDSCMVTRLCIHSNEFQNEEKLLESIIKTYRDIRGLDENPLIIIGLNESIDITISRDRNIITIEHRYHQHYEISRTIKKLVETVIGFFLTKDDLENAKMEYNENILVEGESLGNRIYEKIDKIVDTIDKIRERHGHKIVFCAALITIPLIFLFFLYSRTNPSNSYFQAAIATIPAIVFAVVATREHRKSSLIKTFGQKKFPACIWFSSMLIYICIRSFGLDIYLAVLLYMIIFSIGIIVIIESIPMLRKLSPPIERVFSHVVRRNKTKVKKPSIFQSKTGKKLGRTLSIISNNYITKKIWMVLFIIWTIFSIILKIALSISGVIVVIIFAIAFLPMMGIFVLVNFLNRGYWRDLDKYRENIIEKAVHKYREDRKLAPSCRVIFSTTKCKRLKNPLSGTWKILSKKVPRILTIEGFIDVIDKLVLRGWM